MAGQLWSTDSAGGYMYSDELSDFLRTALQPMARFRQFCDAKEAKGKSKGETFNWNKYSDVATAGGAVQETDTTPETNFTITQASLTVTEYTNSVPYTKKLDDLSRHPVREVITKVLKNDARKALDTAAHAQFVSTLLMVQPTSGSSTTAVTVSTNGATAATTSVAMSNVHVKLVADELKERNITPYYNDDYFCIGRPKSFRAFKDDLESIHQNVESGMQHIYNGEIGRYEGIRFVEQTHIADSWTGTGASAGQAWFFGADTVCEAISEPEQMRGKIPTDFGRSKGIAWYYLGGFGIVHNETGATENRIMEWGSTV